MVNTYLYSVYGQGAANTHINDQAITDYRQAWLNAIVSSNQLEAIVTLGSLADTAYHQWLPHAPTETSTIAYRHVTHPTSPNSGAAAGGDYAALVREMLANWNAAPPGSPPADPPSRRADGPAPLRHRVQIRRRRRDPRGRPARRPPGMDAQPQRTGPSARVGAARPSAPPSSSRSPPTPAPGTSSSSVLLALRRLRHPRLLGGGARHHRRRHVQARVALERRMLDVDRVEAPRRGVGARRLGRRERREPLGRDVTAAGEQPPAAGDGRGASRP